MNLKLIYITINLLIFAITSCNVKQQKITYVLKNITTKGKIVKFPIEKMKNIKQIIDKSNLNIYNFYTNRLNFVWFNSELELKKEAKKFIYILENSKYYGLPSKRYKIKNLKQNLILDNVSETELLLTKNYIKFGNDITNGTLKNVKDYYPFRRYYTDTNWIKVLEKGIIDNTIIKELLSLQPKNPEYKRLKKGLEKYLNKVEINNKKIKVNYFKKDSVKTYQTAKKALLLHGIIKDTNISTPLIIEGIKKFQYEHGLIVDGIIGKKTAQELSKSTNYFYKQAQKTLERWRWTKPFEEEHIFVNIATYKLKYYTNNDIKLENKIVVGKEDTETPELNSKMNYMITHPFWYVPESIVKEELTIKVQKDPQYLEKNEYEVLKGGNIVPSYNIELEKLEKYQIRQKGGKKNALGKIKFIFPNKHSVYFHDTPSKHIFDKERRAYSHGCIRLESPIKFAEHLLKNETKNKYSKDTIKHYAENNIRKVITLNKKTPIYIRYYTTEADSNNNIIFYSDIYKKYTFKVK